ncbi:MAG: leucyl aminopeptidase [Pseudomonadota bacterium]
MFTIQQKRATTKIEKIKGTVICVITDQYDSEIVANFSEETAKYLRKALKVAKFKNDAGHMMVFHALDGLVADKLIIVATGDKTDNKGLEKAGGKIAAKIYHSEKDAHLFFLTEAVDFDILNRSAFLLGVALRCYHFDHYRTTQKDDETVKLQNIVIYDEQSKDLDAEFQNICAITDGVFMARDLVSEPSNILYPETYAERCLELKKLGLKVTVLDEKKMLKEGMHSLLGVGQGSVRESKAVILEWKNNKNKNAETLALVGKGVTFDSGGLSLKPGKGMWDMIFDMGGSAAVVGTMVTLATRRAHANVVGIIGLVENMPDGNAQRPGDVVETLSGKTVEVLNTDAEGRLVLADIMTYVQKTYKPHAMIDLATLTGAIISALGHEYAGLFSNNKDFADKIEAAAQLSGDKVWPFPMGPAYSDKLKSRVADIANISQSAGAGSITAAEFLKHFVENDLPWAHLDIAGTAWTYEERPTNPKGATGFGVRLLNQFVLDHYEG